MYNFIHYPSDVAAILESGFSPITSSSKCSFFNGSGLKPFSGLVTPCSKGGSVDEQTPMAKASGIERSARDYWEDYWVVKAFPCCYQVTPPGLPPTHRGWAVKVDRVEILIDIMDLHKWLFWASSKMIILKKEKIIPQQNNDNANNNYHQPFCILSKLFLSLNIYERVIGSNPTYWSTYAQNLICDQKRTSVAMALYFLQSSIQLKFYTVSHPVIMFPCQ